MKEYTSERFNEQRTLLLQNETLIIDHRQDKELIHRLHRLREMNVSFKKKNNTSNHRPNSSDSRSLKLLEAANKQSAHGLDFIKRASLDIDTENSSEDRISSIEPSAQNNNQHGDQGLSKHSNKLHRAVNHSVQYILYIKLLHSSLDNSLNVGVLRSHKIMSNKSQYDDYIKITLFQGSRKLCSRRQNQPSNEGHCKESKFLLNDCTISDLTMTLKIKKWSTFPRRNVDICQITFGPHAGGRAQEHWNTVFGQPDTPTALWHEGK